MFKYIFLYFWRYGLVYKFYPVILPYLVLVYFNRPLNYSAFGIMFLTSELYNLKQILKYRFGLPYLITRERGKFKYLYCAVLLTIMLFWLLITICLTNILNGSSVDLHFFLSFVINILLAISLGAILSSDFIVDKVHPVLTRFLFIMGFSIIYFTQEYVKIFIVVVFILLEYLTFHRILKFSNR